MNRMFRGMTGGDARKAFTLIEMMLTIALITLLSSLFVWNITSLLKQGSWSLFKTSFGARSKKRSRALFLIVRLMSLDSTKKLRRFWFRLEASNFLLKWKRMDLMMAWKLK
ncbi:MAG: prepilin-type N-terminal cleavage/methylation domain-containing protein [Verrucomicrobiia bacterium]